MMMLLEAALFPLYQTLTEQSLTALPETTVDAAGDGSVVADTDGVGQRRPFGSTHQHKAPAFYSRQSRAFTLQGSHRVGHSSVSSTRGTEFGLCHVTWFVTTPHLKHNMDILLNHTIMSGIYTWKKPKIEIGLMVVWSTYEWLGTFACKPLYDLFVFFCEHSFSGNHDCHRPTYFSHCQVCRTDTFSRNWRIRRWGKEPSYMMLCLSAPLQQLAARIDGCSHFYSTSWILL